MTALSQPVDRTDRAASVLPGEGDRATNFPPLGKEFTLSPVFWKRCQVNNRFSPLISGERRIGASQLWRSSASMQSSNLAAIADALQTGCRSLEALVDA